MVDLYIVGAGGLGRGLADALIYDGKQNVEEKFNNIYFVDDNHSGSHLNGIPVKYSLDYFVNLEIKCLVINAIGSPWIRKDIQSRLEKNPNFVFPNYIDKDIKIYNHVKIGKGNIITRGAVLSTNISIGNHNLIHFNCSIGHDVIIGNYNCIYPLTSLSGYTSLGDENMIGTGTSTLPRCEIKNRVNVGAHSLLKGSYESNITVFGAPARIKEDN